MVPLHCCRHSLTFSASNFEYKKFSQQSLRTNLTREFFTSNVAALTRSGLEDFFVTVAINSESLNLSSSFEWIVKL